MLATIIDRQVSHFLFISVFIFSQPFAFLSIEGKRGGEGWQSMSVESDAGHVLSSVSIALLPQWYCSGPCAPAALTCHPPSSLHCPNPCAAAQLLHLLPPTSPWCTLTSPTLFPAIYPQIPDVVDVPTHSAAVRRRRLVRASVPTPPRRTSSAWRTLTWRDVELTPAGAVAAVCGVNVVDSQRLIGIFSLGRLAESVAYQCSVIHSSSRLV